MVHSLYRYVTRRLPGNKSRKAPGWYAQDPRSRILQGPFEDEMQAVAVVAKTMKVKVVHLLRSEVEGPAVNAHAAVSTYRHVTQKVMRGITYWMAQPSKNRQKLFKDPAAAAAWAAQQRRQMGQPKRTTKKSLSKGSVLHGRWQYQRRLATVVQVYGGGSELPGDATYLRAHASSMEAIISQEPSMEFLDIQSKYGPCRDALVQVFRSKVSSSKVMHEYEPVSKSGLEALEFKYGADRLPRAQHLLAVLRRTVSEVDGKDLSCWVTNCGRNVSHHSGFVPMLLRLKVLRKVRKSTVPSLDLGSATGRRYQLRTDNLLQALDCLCQVIRLADAVQVKVPSSVPGPRSCSAWVQSFHDLTHVVKECSCPGMRNVKKYLTLWTIRAMLLRRMYASGVSRLALDDSLWSDFAKTFPDQKNMLSKILASRAGRQAEKGLTCRVALERSLYKGPPELMTMYLCFLGAADRTSTPFLSKHQAKMGKMRRNYKTQHKQNPVFRELLKLVKKDLKQVKKNLQRA